MAYKCKRYYWLKLKQDFFADPRIKKLRRIAGGDTYTVILLKLMLLTVKSEGVLIYEGLENTLALELALKMDEDDKNVEATLIYMQSMNLLQELDPKTFDIPQVRELTGSESDSAERKRRQRKRQKKAKSVTLSQEGHNVVTRCHKTVPTEIEIETELEKETDTEIEKNPLFENWLEEYSAGKNTPPAYKAIMRKKIRNGDKDAINTFLEWKNDYEKKAKEDAKRERIRAYNYQTMEGAKLNGQIITRVSYLEDSDYIDIYLDNGKESMLGVKKEEVYKWIHQKKEITNEANNN